MDVKLIKKERRHLLAWNCENGSQHVADLGPNLPLHDLAHLVAEAHLELQHGFYGNLYKGYTMEQLGTRAVIQSLPEESMVAEILTRALQATAGGSCRIEEYEDLVNTEFAVHGMNYRWKHDQAVVRSMLAKYLKILNAWYSLEVGGQLKLAMKHLS